MLAVLRPATSGDVARAHQYPPPTLVASFDCSDRVFAAFCSFAMFGDPPHGPTLLEITIIAAVGKTCEDSRGQSAAMQRKRCRHCQTEHPGFAAFCRHCGRRF